MSENTSSEVSSTETYDSIAESFDKSIDKIIELLIKLKGENIYYLNMDKNKLNGKT